MMKAANRVFSVCLSFIFILSLLAMPQKEAQAVVSIVINELDSDTPTAPVNDDMEFIELYDGGVGTTALDGLVVVFYNGAQANDPSYAAFDLDGFSTDANGYFVLGNAGVVPTPSLTFTLNTLQNGADAVALYAGDATSFPTNTPLTTTNLLDAIVYDTADPDDPGLLVLLNAGQPQVDENSGLSSATQSNQRCPNGSGGARNTNTYIQNTPTPGAANYCPDTTSPILTITGATADTVAMPGTLEGGYTLQTNGVPADNHLIQFAAGTSADEPLEDTYFGLFLTDSTVSPADLKAYYLAHGTPSEPVDFLTYLNGAADGLNPFVYIKGSSVTLVDAAKHDLLATDADMTVPDDFPVGTYTVEGSIRDTSLNPTPVKLILIVLNHTTGPVLTITGATADSIPLTGSLASGYTLKTTRVPIDDWLVQFAAGTTSNVPLADTYFGLKLVSSSVSAAELKAYYLAHGTPSEPVDFLTYLNGAADGLNPFVYIMGSSVTLVDAAKHDLISTDVAMTIPDDFPVGTYTVEGVVTDTALNETTVTLKLVVTDSTLAPVLTITGATADGVPMAGDLATGYILETTGNPAGNHYLQFAAGTTSAPALANDYFGLYLIDSTITPEALKAYYVTHGTPSQPYDFLTYLQAAADGINPFVYIRGSDVTLVDAAKYDLMATDGDMTVPDDFPVGTYTVEGIVTDAALNETTVTLILIVVAPTSPAGVGNANPASVLQGNSTLLTVNVTPGTYPVSTGLGVTCDLSSIGGSATQAFFDNATSGDVTAADNIFSYSATVAEDAVVGLKDLTCTVTDGQARTGSASIALTVTVNVCYAANTPIYTIQGSGDSSPLVGNVVTLTGVVTGDYTGLGGTTDFGGFYLQDKTGDGNPLTSDGVFVYKKTIPVTVGHVVVVSGTVKEYNLVTEIDPVTSITDCGAYAIPVTPLTITLPLAAGATFEPYEGMLVSFANTMVVAQNYFLGRYGQMHLSTERFFNPTNGQGDTVDEFLRSSFVLDDAKSSQNPNPTPYIGTGNTVRAGDTVAAGLTGFMDQGAISNISGIYGYRLQPLAYSVLITRTNARLSPPILSTNTLRVVGFNVENYFVTLDATPYPDGSPYVPENTPRGADSATEFTRQREKLFAGLAVLNPDVFGVTEIESWDGANAPANFATGLNATAGVSGTYAFIADPATGVGSDPIQNSLFYKVGSVTPVGVSMSSTDAIFKRAPIAQTFEDANGNKFSVIVNHFKSKGSCPAPEDPNYDLEKDNGQGCWTYTRTLEAQALLTFIQQVKTASGDQDVLVIGDLNSYGEEDPINTLTNGGLHNEMAIQVPAVDRYSYIFDGYSGYLDHALSSASLHPQVLDVQPWHINADEPSFIDYNTEFKTTGTYPPDLYTANAYRSSDHDPIIIDLQLTTPVISGLIPNKIQKGSQAFVLTVNGSNFETSSQVYWNGSPRTTTFVNTGQLTVQISAADVAAIDIVDVTVGDSLPSTFTIYTFADTLPTAWYWKWVEGFYAQNITTGCALNPFRYCPDRPVTRAEMAVFILRAQNVDVPGYSPNPIATEIFDDVPVASKQWMQPWIEEFYEQGITTGCWATPLRFCPEREVTRAEMAVFILRAKYGATYTPPPATGDIFTDIPVASKEWMAPWIEQFYREGITTGCAVGLYCPEQSVTRAEMAVFIDRAFGFPQLP